MKLTSVPTEFPDTDASRYWPSLSRDWGEDGWQCNIANKRSILRHFVANTSAIADARNPYWTWASPKGGSQYWDNNQPFMLFKNNNTYSVKMNKIKMQICSCNSGGSPYYSDTGRRDACDGSSAKYQVFLRVQQNEKTSTNAWTDIDWIESASQQYLMPKLQISNMDSPGSTGNPAVFHFPDKYSETEPAGPVEFEIKNAPEIGPGMLALLCLSVTGNPELTSSMNIKFDMTADAMGIEVEGEDQPYIWLWTGTSWELRKPGYIYQTDDNGNTRWIPLEERFNR